MAKAAASGKPKGAVREAEAFDARKIDLTRFKPDISLHDWTELYRAGNFPSGPLFFEPIETLTPAKTVGKGRTNLTIIMSTIVQVDATTPYAGFNRMTTPARDPIIQIHFQPSGYGFTAPGTYIIAFSLEVVGQSTFNVVASTTPGTVTGTGSRVVSGQSIVSLIFNNLPASQQVYAYLEQKAGGQWNWYSTRVSLPPILIQL